MSNLDKNPIKDLVTEYFITQHYDDLMNILKSTETSQPYSIPVDLLGLISNVPELNQDFFTSSAYYIRLFQECVQEAQNRLLKMEENLNLKLTLKPKVTVRLHSLPCAQDVEVQLPKCMHSNKFVQFNGTVTKTFDKRCIFTKQLYSCVKCSNEFSLDIDFSYVDFFLKPEKCPCSEDCKSDKFNQVEMESKPSFKTSLSDYQELKVQEKLDIMSMGTVPKSVIVIVEDDLVNCCKPGDDITINGLVLRQWKRPEPNMRCEIEIIMHANYIKINNQQQTHSVITEEKKLEFEKFWQQYKDESLRARNIILKSICPSLYGMYVVRLAVSLVLTGGVSRKEQDNGIKTRGESHLLLVGDPGTGKSQILKFASKIIPRGVNTTGMGSSSSGLTATASREGGQWHLEPGALVLADGGICCIDEFNCMKNDDKNSMLEAMEQQSISIAKAGIVCNLKTQCSILAACNPKGRYDSNEPVTVNLGIPSPLLSRFDVVLLLMDTPNRDWDYAASTYLLQGIDFRKSLITKNDSTCTSINEDKPWSFQDLRLYINYVKGFEPKISYNANLVIQKYYVIQRAKLDSNKARTTTRMLESIIRLSQAHAKLMHRKEVLVMDAIVAISLIESSLDQTSLFNSVNILHTSFSDNPEKEYREQAKLILSKLDLQKIWKEEFLNKDSNLNLSPDKESLKKEIIHEQLNSDQTDAFDSNDVKNISLLKMNTQITQQQKPDDNIPVQKPKHSSLANKRKFIEEELLESPSIDRSSSKRAKPISFLNQFSQSSLLNNSNSQMVSSTQNIPSQSIKQDYEVEEIDIDSE